MAQLKINAALQLAIRTFALFLSCFVHRDGSAAQPLPAQTTTQTKPPPSKRTRCPFFVKLKTCLRATGPPSSRSSLFCRVCRRPSKIYILRLRTPNATMADFTPDPSPEQVPTTRLPVTTTIGPTPTPNPQDTPSLNGSLFTLAHDLTSYFLGQTLHLPTFISNNPLNTLFASAAVGIGARLLYNDHTARSRSRVQLAVFHILRILQANPSYWRHVSDENNWPTFRRHVVEEVRRAVEKHHISRSEGGQVKKIIEKRLINMLWDYEGSLRAEVIRKRRKLLVDQLEDDRAKERYLAKKRRETGNPLWPSHPPPLGAGAVKKPSLGWDDDDDDMDDDMDDDNEDDGDDDAAPFVDSATPGNSVVYPALPPGGNAATPAPVSRPPNSGLNEAAAAEAAAMAPFDHSPAIPGTVALPFPKLPHGYVGIGGPFAARPQSQSGSPGNAAASAKRPTSGGNTTSGSNPSSTTALPPMASNPNRPNVPKVDAVPPPVSGNIATPAPVSRPPTSQSVPPSANSTVATSTSTSRPTSNVVRPPAATATNHPEDAPVMVSVRPPKMTPRYRAIPFQPVVPDERERRRLIGDEGRRWWPCAICDMMVDAAPIPWTLHIGGVAHLHRAYAAADKEKEKEKEKERVAAAGDDNNDDEEVVENATARPPSPNWTCHKCGKKLFLSQMDEHRDYHKNEEEAAALKNGLAQFGPGNTVTGTPNAAHPSGTDPAEDDENDSWRCLICDRFLPLAEKSKHLNEHSNNNETGIDDQHGPEEEDIPEHTYDQEYEIEEEDVDMKQCHDCGLYGPTNHFSQHLQSGCEGLDNLRKADMTKCSDCGRWVPYFQMGKHRQEACVRHIDYGGEGDRTKCPECQFWIPYKDFDKHQQEWCEMNRGKGEEDKVKCPECGVWIPYLKIDEHQQKWCEMIWKDKEKEEDRRAGYTYCGRCNMQVPVDKWDTHVERHHQNPPTSDDDDQSDDDQDGGANGNTDAFGQLIKPYTTNTPAPPSQNSPTPVPPPSAQLDDLRRPSQPAIAVSTNITAFPNGQVVITPTPTTPAPGPTQHSQPTHSGATSVTVSPDGVVTITPTPNLPQYPRYPQLPHTPLYSHVRPTSDLLEREERKAWHAVGFKTPGQYWAKVNKGLSPIIELEEDDEGYTPDSVRLARLARQGVIPWPAGLSLVGTGIVVDQEEVDVVQQQEDASDGVDPDDLYSDNDAAAHVGATLTPAPRPPLDIDSDDPDGLYTPPSPRPQPNSRAPPISPQVVISPPRQPSATSIPRPTHRPRSPTTAPVPASQRPPITRPSSATSATSATSQSNATKPSAKTGIRKPEAKKGQTSRQPSAGSQTSTGSRRPPPPSRPPPTPGSRRSGRENRYTGTYSE
ncbi:hypothetical protein PMIN01_10137 [Paraphaeosphaeria minitans]|uniref:C2H2-type domain-containing protein n=1 Tax=Paraphaeosphaeria minitans TaxID=565426 RepID=A0A9P6GBS1_9PLEO|nr:hypothetical protein PMIN01_10137 [Paraphaeosphaeria minitans]